MSPEAVHAILADLERSATRIPSRPGGAEMWRFKVDSGGIEYDLHFFPDEQESALRTRLGGSRATRQFTQLQSLQTLAIPAARVIASLKGLRVGERKGDGCIVVHDPTAIPLDEVLRSPPQSHRERLELIAALIERLESLGKINMCPMPLRPELFALRDVPGGKTLLLIEGDWTLAGRVTAERLSELDALTRHVTRVSDRLRIWKHFMRDAPPPRRDRALARSSRRLVGESVAGIGAFGHIESGAWVGQFLRRVPMVLPWSKLGGVELSHDDWLRVLPAILDTSRGVPFKADHAALVTGQTIELAGRQIDIVVKRPAFKEGFHGAVQRYRRSRVKRAWTKTWRMLGLGLSCEMPLLMLERRRGWRLVEQIYVAERVPGPTIATADLDALAPAERWRLLWAAGRMLRQLENGGLRHADAKSVNWIAWTDAAQHIRPIMLDLDSIRIYGSRGVGIARLTRAMKQHPQVSDADLVTLASGYRWPK